MIYILFSKIVWYFVKINRRKRPLYKIEITDAYFVILFFNILWLMGLSFLFLPLINILRLTIISLTISALANLIICSKIKKKIKSTRIVYNIQYMQNIMGVYLLIIYITTPLPLLIFSLYLLAFGNHL